MEPFDPDRCPIPPITRIPQTPLLPDTAVPDPPAEIIDCLDPLTPLAAEPPCPTLTIGESILNIGVPASEAGVLLTAVKGTCCAYDLSLTVNLPELTADCPELTSAPVRTVAYTDPTIAPAGTSRVVITPAPDCAFEVDIDLALHCPGLTVSEPVKTLGFRSDGVGRSQFTVTRGAGCDYSFDLAIDAPCPPITVGGAQSTAFPLRYTSASVGHVVMTITPGPDCTYDIDLDVAVPCVPLTVAGEQSKTFAMRYSSESVGRFALAIVPGADCVYDFAVDISIPCVPLTTFGDNKKSKPVEFTTYNSASAGAVLFSVVKSANCVYDLQATLSMASPGMAAYTEAAGVSAKSGGTAGFGFVTLYRIDRFTGVMTTVATHVKVYNNMTTAIAGNVDVQLINADGALLVASEDC